MSVGVFAVGAVAAVFLSGGAVFGIKSAVKAAREEGYQHAARSVGASALRSAAAAKHQQMFAVYQAFLDRTPLGADIRDASTLPYPKPRIEDGCLLLIAAATTDQQRQELTEALLKLAQFQKVGRTLKAPGAAPGGVEAWNEFQAAVQADRARLADAANRMVF